MFIVLIKTINTIKKSSQTCVTIRFIDFGFFFSSDINVIMVPHNGDEIKMRDAQSVLYDFFFKYSIFI